MQSIEETIVRDLVVYSALGMVLRFLLYGFPTYPLLWIFLILSFCVGIGGAAMDLGRAYSRRNYMIVGALLAMIGLLPFHYLF